MSRRKQHLTTDESLPLDIRGLQRGADLHGYARLSVSWTHGQSNSSIGVAVYDGTTAILTYADRRGDKHSETLEIVWTRPNYGGKRPWWTCPSCSRRCAIVYALGVNPFTCRLCASLTYVTAQSDRFSRAARKSVNSQRRLGWEIGAPFPNKPKGMQWRTWERLVAECSEAVAAAHVAFENWVDQMD